MRVQPVMFNNMSKRQIIRNDAVRNYNHFSIPHDTYSFDTRKNLENELVFKGDYERLSELEYCDYTDLASNKTRYKSYESDEGNGIYRYFPVKFNNPESLQNAAEHAYNESDIFILKYICGQRREFKASYRAAKKRFEKLQPYLKKVRDKMEFLSNEINKLGPIVTGHVYDIIQQKEKLVSNFFKPIEMERERVAKPDITNGILLYGTSEAGMQGLIDWCKLSGNVIVEEVEYDHNDPEGSFEKIAQVTEEAEYIYKMSSRRTLLHIENLDQLLIDQYNPRSLAYIGKFKNLAETSAEKYHTTILLTTTKDIDYLEEASISPQRFGIKIKVDQIQASEDEQKRYHKYTEEYNRLIKLGEEDWREEGYTIYSEVADFLRELDGSDPDDPDPIPWERWWH